MSNVVVVNDSDNSNKDEKKMTKTSAVIIVIVILILYIWAIILAMRVPDQHSRTLHLIFALSTGPFYVFCYYLSAWKA